MPAPRPGLYESLVSEALESELKELPEGFSPRREPLRRAEAGDRLGLYLSRLIESAVDGLDEKNRVEKGLALSRALVETLARETGNFDLLRDSPVLEDSVLLAVQERSPDGSLKQVNAPKIPLLDTALLTNSPGEPGIGHQLRSEIESAHRIDLIVAFIRRSAIRRFREDLRRFCSQGGELRVLTTTYTGTTELEALELLTEIGAETRVSYDLSATRLHAKAWVFHREGGLSTAYIGSSNLTHQAQQTGLEWNVRVSSGRNGAVVDKMAAVFSAYWEGGDFVPFDRTEFARRTAKERARAKSLLPPIEIRLEPFQERLLEEIEVARQRGQHANLLVSATGTGKTVMAAIDYLRLREKLPRKRLLFVAHRKEILEQSRSTFRQALRDAEFGELWVGGERPSDWDAVFASIQSLSAADLSNLDRDHFDVVVVDEFHHAAAKSYAYLLDHLKPRELLGLTATPERADGLPILEWFEGRISAELRLWDAIDQGRLVPFEYYGVHDGTDLSQISWRRGRGYDVEGLTSLYTADDAWARLVLSQLEDRVHDLGTMRALGFCVSVEHAQFMARVFCENGVNAAAVWGDTPADERRDALSKLRDREIQILFSVDLFNEGVDLPTVDTLLLLRPTESATLFLQQLGRGLRKAVGKTSCLVLDFVGQPHREFRFHYRLQALLGGSRKHVEKQVDEGFPFLPAGCHLELESRAHDIVLKSIKRAVPSQWSAKAAELRKLASEGRDAMADFLADSGLELEDVYTGTRSWSDLREAAGVSIFQDGPQEKLLRRACGRLLHVDDMQRLESYESLVERSEPPTFEDARSHDARLARMLISSVCDKAVSKAATLSAGIQLLWQHPQVLAELRELFEFLKGRVDHNHEPLDKVEAISLADGDRGLSRVPLQVHARYTRLEIVAAFQPELRAKVPAWQTGAYWMEEAKADLLAFTLDKTSGQFSPTTRYRDYAISPSLIHWESQGVVRAESRTGLRYRHHVEQGSSIMLFARERADERAFWFLGPARFVRSEGERPMAITWRLERDLPGDLYAAFAAAVA